MFGATKSPAAADPESTTSRLAYRTWPLFKLDFGAATLGDQAPASIEVLADGIRLTWRQSGLAATVTGMFGAVTRRWSLPWGRRQTSAVGWPAIDAVLQVRGESGPAWEVHHRLDDRAVEWQMGGTWAATVPYPAGTRVVLGLELRHAAGAALPLPAPTELRLAHLYPATSAQFDTVLAHRVGRLGGPATQMFLAAQVLRAEGRDVADRATAAAIVAYKSIEIDVVKWGQRAHAALDAVEPALAAQAATAGKIDSAWLHLRMARWHLLLAEGKIDAAAAGMQAIVRDAARVDDPVLASDALLRSCIVLGVLHARSGRHQPALDVLDRSPVMYAAAALLADPLELAAYESLRKVFQYNVYGCGLAAELRNPHGRLESLCHDALAAALNLVGLPRQHIVDLLRRQLPSPQS